MTMEQLNVQAIEAELKRRHLINEWHKCQDPEEKGRIFRDSVDADQKLNDLIYRMMEMEEAEKKRKYEHDHQMLQLTCACSRTFPIARITVCLRKDYKPNRKCDVCGEELLIGNPCKISGYEAGRNRS